MSLIDLYYKKVLSLLYVAILGLGINKNAFSIPNWFQVCNFDSDYTLNTVIGTHLDYQDDGQAQSTLPITLHAGTPCSPYHQYLNANHDAWHVYVSSISSISHLIDPDIGPWTTNGTRNFYRICNIYGHNDGKGNYVQLFIKNPAYSNFSVTFDVIVYANGDYKGSKCDFNIRPENIQ